jgi:hypothetical protein
MAATVVDVYEVLAVGAKSLNLPRKPEVEISEGRVGAPDGPKLQVALVNFEDGKAFVQAGIRDALVEHYPGIVVVTGRKRQAEIFPVNPEEVSEADPV